MHPHQQHLINKLRPRGWLTETGQVVWPTDDASRKIMARELLGSELVNSIDYWSSLANDQLDDAYLAPWAKPKPADSEDAKRRAIFKTLSAEQREAVRWLIGDSLKAQLYSFCITLDRSLGEISITVKPDENSPIEVHSSEKDQELYIEHYHWIDEYSFLHGKDAVDRASNSK
jgi:hypothetical protein